MFSWIFRCFQSTNWGHFTRIRSHMHSLAEVEFGLSSPVRQQDSSLEAMQYPDGFGHLLPPTLFFWLFCGFFRCYPCLISPSLAVSSEIATLSLSLHALVGHSMWLAVKVSNAKCAAGICECPNHFTYPELEKRLGPTIAKSLFYPSLPWMVCHPCMELHPGRNGYSPCWI